MAALIHSFFNDVRVQVALLLVLLDLALGVLAAVKAGNFRLSYISDVLRADVLFKVLPFFLLYGAYKYASGADLVIPGLDMEVVMNGAWVIVLAAMVGSILNSLRDLGLASKAPDAIAGPDPNSALEP